MKALLAFSGLLGAYSLGWTGVHRLTGGDRSHYTVARAFGLQKWFPSQPDSPRARRNEQAIARAQSQIAAAPKLPPIKITTTTTDESD